MRVTAALAPRCTSVQEEEGSHPRRRYCPASTGARWCQRCPMPGRRRSTTSPHTSPGQARRAAAGAVSTPGAGPHKAGGRGRGALRTLFVWPRNFRGVAACKRVSNTLIAPSAAQTSWYYPLRTNDPVKVPKRARTQNEEFRFNARCNAGASTSPGASRKAPICCCFATGLR